MAYRRPLTTSQVAELFAVTPEAVNNWADAGKLPCFRTPGGHRRFRPEDVEAFLTGQAQVVEPKAAS